MNAASLGLTMTRCLGAEAGTPGCAHIWNMDWLLLPISNVVCHAMRMHYLFCRRLVSMPECEDIAKAGLLLLILCRSARKQKRCVRKPGSDTPPCFDGEYGLAYYHFLVANDVDAGGESFDLSGGCATEHE